MSTTLDQYREAKQNWLKLRNQAKKELVTRFHEVGAELLQIQRELLEDFGEKVSLPLKAKKGPAKKAAPAPAPPVAAKPVPTPSKPAPANPLEKLLAVQKKKLAEAKAAGKATKAIEDRIYEIEDDIRVAANS
ncbi:hypothetical protein [Bryobacter aggregatus]|uniref:hypothetical protein n=1 Tax=Bryobacter aggregatus TaxID=360054 RepID=UPI0004E21DFE|nr:hypothetical protein [Bryobacter aggregatus]